MCIVGTLGSLHSSAVLFWYYSGDELFVPQEFQVNLYELQGDGKQFLGNKTKVYHGVFKPLKNMHLLLGKLKWKMLQYLS